LNIAWIRGTHTYIGVRNVISGRSKTPNGMQQGDVEMCYDYEVYSEDVLWSTEFRDIVFKYATTWGYVDKDKWDTDWESLINEAFNAMEATVHSEDSTPVVPFVSTEWEYEQTRDGVR